jgi:hypothetical protein
MIQSHLGSRPWVSLDNLPGDILVVGPCACEEVGDRLAQRYPDWRLYRVEEHKKTAHCPTWRDTVAEMMAEPRSSVKYDNVFPDDEGWG